MIRRYPDLVPICDTKIVKLFDDPLPDCYIVCKAIADQKRRKFKLVNVSVYREVSDGVEMCGFQHHYAVKYHNSLYDYTYQQYDVLFPWMSEIKEVPLVLELVEDTKNVYRYRDYILVVE